MTAHFEEEAWEVEIGAMLGRLPAVGPPDGFIDAALDHRPLNAGRTMVGLGALAVAAVVAALATGAVSRGEITVEPDEVAERHVAVEAAVLGASGGDDADDVRLVAEPVDPPIDLAAGFRPTTTVLVDDVIVTAYERGDESITLSTQIGEVNWEALPARHLTELAGHRVWVEPERRLSVLQVGDRIVTIVALAPRELEAALADMSGGDRTWWDRVEDTAAAIARQLGYPDVGIARTTG